MELCEFIEAVKQEAEKLCGQEYTIRIQKVLKNNNQKYTGLEFQKKENRPAGDITPIIYLDSYYELWQEGVLSPAETARRILDAAQEKNDYVAAMTANLANFEALKEKVCYRLVNYESNRELLKTVPFKRFCDLAVIFYLYIGNYEGNMMTVLIYKGHMEAWGTDIDTLYRLAGENTSRIFPSVLRPMEEVIKDILKRSSKGRLEEGMIEQTFERGGKPQLYVLSNQRGVNGASVILYDGVLKACAKSLGSDFIILPSSIHEVLLLPCEEDMDAAELASMVGQINESEVAPEEVLSGNVYRYTRAGDMVCVISGDGQVQHNPEKGPGALGMMPEPVCAF